MQLSQSIVRRRKEDTGEPLVERTYFPVRVPFGQRQREPHEKWLKGFERFFCETHPRSPLVEGAWCTRSRPRSANTAEARVRRRPFRRRPGTRLDRITASNWTPKRLKLLELCLERVGAGDEVVVGSCLIETGRILAERLRAGRARCTHRRGARRPRPDQEPAQTRGRGVRVRGGRRRRALRPTRTLGARDASSAR